MTLTSAVNTESNAYDTLADNILQLVCNLNVIGRSREVLLDAIVIAYTDLAVEDKFTELLRYQEFVEYFLNLPVIKILLYR